MSSGPDSEQLLRGIEVKSPVAKAFPALLRAKCGLSLTQSLGKPHAEPAAVWLPSLHPQPPQYSAPRRLFVIDDVKILTVDCITSTRVERLQNSIVRGNGLLVTKCSSPWHISLLRKREN